MKVRNKIIAWVEKSNNINELKNALIEILDNNSVDLDELFRNHKNEINNSAKKKQKKLNGLKSNQIIFIKLLKK